MSALYYHSYNQHTNGPQLYWLHGGRKLMQSNPWLNFLFRFVFTTCSYATCTIHNFFKESFKNKLMLIGFLTETSLLDMFHFIWMQVLCGFLKISKISAEVPFSFIWNKMFRLSLFKTSILTLTLTLSQSWWARCEKNSPEGGREGGEKKRMQHARGGWGSNPDLPHARQGSPSARHWV